VYADYVFGCSSVNTDNVLEISILYRFLMQSHAIDETYGIQPRKGFRGRELGRNMDLLDQLDFGKKYGDKIVPGLLKSYIKAGSVIASEPAYDRSFGCTDFLTVLNTSLINENYRKKFVESS